MCDFKKILKSVNRFNSISEIDNYNNKGGGEGGKINNKSRRNYSKSQNIRIINASLESLLPVYFPSLGVTVHLASLDAFQHCWSLDLLWGQLRL